jgi:hypothetical protein
MKIHVETDTPARPIERGAIGSVEYRSPWSNRSIKS